MQGLEFSGGRRVSPRGAVTVFSGLPTGAADPELDDVEAFAETDEIRTALETLISRWQGEVQLQYMARRAVRSVCRGGRTAHPSAGTAWALAGNVVTPAGRVVPVGWSGQGTGLKELNDEERAERFAWMLAAIDRAEPVPSGPVAAVLAPPAAAVLIHEAIGHFAEAAPEGRVDVRHRLNVRIASEIFHLQDHPMAEGGAAHYAVDDDGVPSLGPVEIVHAGCTTALLHSAKSAAAIGEASTANGRSASIWDPPLPRMSNLICRPGEDSEERLLEDLGDGVYVHSLSHGTAFANRLGAHVRLAEKVVRGRRTGAYLAGGVVDETRGALLRAAALGDVSLFNENGMCGKDGQVLYDVGTRAPAIRMESLRLRA